MVPCVADPRNRPENLVKTEFLQQHIVHGGMSLRVGAGCCRGGAGGWGPPAAQQQNAAQAVCHTFL